MLSRSTDTSPFNFPAEESSGKCWIKSSPEASCPLFRSMLSLVHQNTHEEPTAKLWQVFASSDDDPEPYNLQQAQSRYSYEVLCLAVLWFCAEATHDDCPLAHHQQQQLERQQQQQHQQLQQQHKHCHDCHGFLLCCVVLFSFFVFLWLLLAVSRRLGGS